MMLTRGSSLSIGQKRRDRCSFRVRPSDRNQFVIKPQPFRAKPPVRVTAAAEPRVECFQARR